MTHKPRLYAPLLVRAKLSRMTWIFPVGYVAPVCAKKSTNSVSLFLPKIQWIRVSVRTPNAMNTLFFRLAPGIGTRNCLQGRKSRDGRCRHRLQLPSCKCRGRKPAQRRSVSEGSNGESRRHSLQVLTHWKSRRTSGLGVECSFTD